MRTGISKWLGWVGIVLWLAGCNSEQRPNSGDGNAALLADAAAEADDDAGSACASDDDAAPVVQGRQISLWPPNHKFHEVDVGDCVTARDACDPSVRAEFIWASSDEPIDSIGDGHHAPDIGRSPGGTRVCVRSERQGPKDGRVYKLGVRVTDDSGNSTEGSCTIVVDHDQRGVVAADSGEAYRVTFSAAQGGVACADPDEPPPPPPGDDTPPPPPPGDDTPPPPPPPPPGDDTPDPDGPG